MKANFKINKFFVKNVTRILPFI